MTGKTNRSPGVLIAIALVLLLILVVVLWPRVAVLGLNPTRTLCTAAQNGDTAAIAKILDISPGLVNSTGWDGTPLHYAAYRGQYDAARLLLERGADPNIKDDRGKCPLHAAAFYGDVKVVEVLLSHKANPNAVTDYGYTPLLAITSNTSYPPHPEDIPAAPGTPPPPASRSSHSPDSRMKHPYDSVRIAQALLNAGAHVNAATPEGLTALHFAVKSGHGVLVQLLLAHGADPLARDQEGKTPREMLTMLPSYASTETRQQMEVLLDGQDD